MGMLLFCLQDLSFFVVVSIAEQPYPQLAHSFIKCASKFIQVTIIYFGLESHSPSSALIYYALILLPTSCKQIVFLKY